jgi:RNA polymerase sigma factor (sigma-70 family)
MGGDTSSEARLSDLVERYGGLINSVVARLVRGRFAHTQDDVKQEVIIALWKRLKNETPIEHPKSYLYQIARREAIRVLQREGRRTSEVTQDPESVVGGGEGPFGQVAGVELGRRINRAIDSLSSDRQRAVRSHLMGFNIQEIMNMHGWTYQTARNLVSRGMADLRELLSMDASK